MREKARKILSLVLCFGLLFQQIGFAQVAAQLDISSHLTQLHNAFTVDKFRPAHLRYFSFDFLNSSFNLLLDKGDDKDIAPTDLTSQTQDLFKYFLIGISLPNESFWVNLRPDSENQIIDEELEKTDMGKILLEADLQLKKDTAAFTSPQTPQGKEYWDKLYKKAGEIFGQENITIPTLTRPWIVPGEVIIRYTDNSAYIYKANLNVMLEQDYLKGSATYSFKDERLKQLNEYSSELIRQLIIPELIKEVNIAKRYASLRQVFYSLILAQWFKQKYNGTNSAYSKKIDHRDLTGLSSPANWSKTTYFKEYQESFKNGVYNIKEPVYTPYGQTIRNYFSGGIQVDKAAAGAVAIKVGKGSLLGQGDEFTVALRRDASFAGFKAGPDSKIDPSTQVPNDSNEPPAANSGGRSFNHEDNAELAKLQRQALENREFAAVKYSSVPGYLNDRFDQTMFFLGPLLGQKIIASPHYNPLGQKDVQKIKLSDTQLKALNDVILDRGLANLLKPLTIFFWSGPSTYSLGRSQIWINLASLDNPYQLGDELFHEPTERNDILAGLSSFPQLYTKFQSTLLTPEKRSDALQAKIKELATDSHIKLLGVELERAINLVMESKNKPEAEANRAWLSLGSVRQRVRSLANEQALTAEQQREMEKIEAREVAFLDEVFRSKAKPFGDDSSESVAVPKSEAALVEELKNKFKDKIKKQAGIDLAELTESGEFISAETLVELSKVLVTFVENILRGKKDTLQETLKNAYLASLKGEGKPAFGTEDYIELRRMLDNAQTAIQEFLKHDLGPLIQGGVAANYDGAPAGWNRPAPPSSSRMPDKAGGINLTRINILAQPQLNSLKANFKLPELQLLQNMDINTESLQLKNLIHADILPSPQRIVEYLAAYYLRNTGQENNGNAIICMVNYFKLEEESCQSTDANLRNFLVLIESGQIR